MVETCASCNSGPLEEEQGNVVCTSCGRVQEEARQLLRHDITQSEGLSDPSRCFFDLNVVPTRLKRQLSTREGADTTANQHCMKDCLAIIGSKFCFSSTMKKRAATLIRESLTKEFWRNPVQIKEAVTCVICYLVLKEFSKPGTIDDVREACQISRKLFTNAFFKYAAAHPRSSPSSLNDKFHTSSDEDLVKDMAKSIFERNKPQRELDAIIDRARKLTTLFNAITAKSNLTIKPTVHVSFFYAWKSMDASRVNFSLKDYQAQMSVRYSDGVTEEHVKRRLAKFRNILLDLAKNLQWLKLTDKQLTKNISLYIADILANSSHLIYEKKNTESEKQQPAPPLEDDVDGDAEITDGEIESYLRSDREVAIAKRARLSIEEQSEEVNS